MMKFTRREFVIGAAAGVVTPFERLLSAAEKNHKLQLSACDWSLGARGRLKGLDTARQIGLDGIEISPNSGKPSKVLPLADPANRKQYKDKSNETGIAVSSIGMGLLNGCPLASDARAPGWLEQTIEAAGDLGADVILLAFFGRGDLRKGKQLKTKEIDAVVERLKDAAPKAKECGVILGMEDTLSARQNIAILDRIKHDYVQHYYDVGNATRYGYDVPAEIRLLRDRICQIHFKDYGGWLGTQVKLDATTQAIDKIGYEGWIVLETRCPTGNRVADFKKNADIARKALGMKPD